MSTKRVLRFYRPGDLTGLEYTLNAMSRGGWQPKSPGRFVQTYVPGEGAWIHRFGYCPDRPGSAGEITYRSAQARCGWEPVAARRGWILFRKPLDRGQEGDTLAGHRDPIIALFRARIARLETLRRWMLVLAAGTMLGGYFADLLPLLYSTALPLTVALFVTYRIKFMEEGMAK
jgi:hypothetical protein